ncbi:MAG: LamG domain-containing protein [Victivallaceae bacterium]|nr:LamG domain-containing protein [Victivallaceae bacterium]
MLYPLLSRGYPSKTIKKSFLTIVLILAVCYSLPAAPLKVLSPGKKSDNTQKFLVAEYDFSEGTGNLLKDKSGNGNNGIIHGAKWAKDANNESYLSFDGINDYIEIPFNSTLSLGREFSVEIFVKPGSNIKKEGLTNFRLLIGQSGEYWEPSSSFAIYYIVGSNGINAYIRYGTAHSAKNNEIINVAKGSIFPCNDWTKITFVKDCKFASLYVNSSLAKIVKTRNRNIINSSEKFYIGGVPGKKRYFNGSIKNLKIYYCPILVTANSIKTNSKPYLLMTTSMDEQISSTPLLDITRDAVKLFNDSPFDGIALNVVDIYSAQKIPPEKIFLDKASEFKSVTGKAIWPRVNLNRIYQRKMKHVYNKIKPEAADMDAVPDRAVPVSIARKQSTYYFRKINLIDIYDQAGALTDFYRIWECALKFSKAMKSGIVLDFEDYHSGRKVYDVSQIAAQYNEPVEKIIKGLLKIGAHMVEIASKEYPDVVIITLFLDFHKVKYNRGIPCYTSYDYIAQGMLTRAKEKCISLVLVEGGENSINYVNPSLEGLKNKLAKRNLSYSAWLRRFPVNFKLGGTITVWDDVSKISGWPKKSAGVPNPFQSLEDFTPFLRALSENYDYIWFYQPMCIDYKPFKTKLSQDTQKFHKKLTEIMEQVWNK